MIYRGGVGEYLLFADSVLDRGVGSRRWRIVVSITFSSASVWCGSALVAVASRRICPRVVGAMSGGEDGRRKRRGREKRKEERGLPDYASTTGKSAVLILRGCLVKWTASTDACGERRPEARPTDTDSLTVAAIRTQLDVRYRDSVSSRIKKKHCLDERGGAQ